MEKTINMENEIENKENGIGTTRVIWLEDDIDFDMHDRVEDEDAPVECICGGIIVPIYDNNPHAGTICHSCDY